MKIGIQNFQGVGPYTEIELAPLTLLYGPNSAGKSTVLDALEFIQQYFGGAAKEARESLVRLARYPREYGASSCDPKDRIDPALGYLGSPVDVAFLISSQFSGCRFLGKDQSGLYSGPFSVNNDYSDGTARALLNLFEKHKYSALVSFEDNRFDDNNKPYRFNDFKLATYYLEIDDTPFFFECGRMDYWDDDFADQPTGGFGFNFDHPLIKAIGEECILHPARSTAGSPAFQQFIEGIFDQPTAKARKILSNQAELLKTVMGRPAATIKPAVNRSRKDAAGWHLFNGVLRSNDLELDWRNYGALRAGIREGLLDNEDANFLIFFFSLMFNFHSVSASKMSPLHHAHVPPLRRIPSAKEWFQVPKVWPSGEAGLDSAERAWQELAWELTDWETREKKDGDGRQAPLLALLNESLASDAYLALGYELRGDLVFEIPLDREHPIFSEKKPSIEGLRDSDAKAHFYLWDLLRHTSVELQDVGVGVSQVIPVLVSAQSGQARIVFIQQPELHLHPALQAQLGDVFLRGLPETSAKSALILETHSEHLLLRILRRIRESHLLDKAGTERAESNSGDALPDRHKVRASQVAVIYASKNEQGLTTFKRLRLTDDGEFIDRWPGGFFAERDRELFPDK